VGREGGLEWRASTLGLVLARTRREVGTLWALAWGRKRVLMGPPLPSSPFILFLYIRRCFSSAISDH